MLRRATWARATVALVVLASAAWFYLGTQQGAENPLAALVRDSLDERAIEGRVEQRLDAGSYTYLALRTIGNDELWTVTMGSGAPPGTHVTVRSMGHSDNFYSRRLDRTFSPLVFGIVSRANHSERTPSDAPEQQTRSPR